VGDAVSAEKRKGDAFERDVARVLAHHGFPYAERMLQLGRHTDRGDIAGVPGFYIDTKNQARHQLGVWVDEVCEQAGELVPVVVVKRKGRAADHAYVVLELATFAEVIRDA
jgi:hypothetical protein